MAYPIDKQVCYKFCGRPIRCNAARALHGLIELTNMDGRNFLSHSMRGRDTLQIQDLSDLELLTSETG